MDIVKVEETTALAVIVTPEAWYRKNIPAETQAVQVIRAEKRHLLQGIRPALVNSAVVARQVKSIDTLVGLPPYLSNDIMSQMSIRALQSEFVRIEDDNPDTANSVNVMLTIGLRQLLQDMALLYVRAGTKDFTKEELDVLMSGCERCVLQNFGGLSLTDIKGAFELAAADSNIKAYGSLNVQFLSQILTAYQTRRNRALSAVLDEAAAIEKAAIQAAQLEQRNEAAYKHALWELRCLQAENTKHEQFHSCPTHFAKRFSEEGIFAEMTKEEKLALYVESMQHLAYDLLKDAPKIRGDKARKSLNAYLQKAQIKPIPSNRLGSDNPFAARGANKSFNYDKPEEQFKEFAQMYYAKKVYHKNIMIFTKP